MLVAYVSLTDVLMMLGRLGESAEVGRHGLEVVRRYGSDATVLVANIIEALITLASGTMPTGSVPLPSVASPPTIRTWCS